MSRRAPAETRQEILDQAAAFLSEHPFRELSVPALMARTSVGRSSFYAHFNNLTELVTELLASIRREMRHAGTHRYLSGEGDSRMELRAALKVAVDIWSIHGPMLRAIADAAPLDPALDRQWREFIGLATRAWARRVRADQQADLLGPGDPDEIAHASNLLVASYLNDRLGGPNPTDPSTALATLTFLILSPGFSKLPKN